MCEFLAAMAEVGDQICRYGAKENDDEETHQQSQFNEGYELGRARVEGGLALRDGERLSVPLGRRLVPPPRHPRRLQRLVSDRRFLRVAPGAMYA